MLILDHQSPCDGFPCRGVRIQGTMKGEAGASRARDKVWIPSELPARDLSQPFPFRSHSIPFRKGTVGASLQAPCTPASGVCWSMRLLVTYMSGCICACLFAHQPSATGPSFALGHRGVGSTEESEGAGRKRREGGKERDGGLLCFPTSILPSRQGAALEICLMKEIKRNCLTIFQMRINFSQGPLPLIPEEPEFLTTSLITQTHTTCAETLDSTK